MTCPAIAEEVAKAKKMRASLASQIIQHAVGELVNFNESLLLNRLMTKHASVKLAEVYPSLGNQDGIYKKILRRLKHLRVGQHPQPKSFGEKDLLYEEFFKPKSYKLRRHSISKNNKSNKLEYVAKKFSVFTRDDYVLNITIIYSIIF